MSLVENVAKNIQKYRKVSIAKLAQKAQISQYTLQKIIYCKYKDIGINTLHKIAKALNVSVEKLIL